MEDFLFFISTRDHLDWFLLGLFNLAAAMLIGIDVFLITAVSAFAVSVMAFLFNMHWHMHWLTFAVVTVVVSIVLAKHSDLKRKSSDDAAGDINSLNSKLVGQIGVVTESIVAVGGRVEVGGSNWQATCDGAQGVIDVGASVKVLSAENNTVVVEVVRSEPTAS